MAIHSANTFYPLFQQILTRFSWFYGEHDGKTNPGVRWTLSTVIREKRSRTRRNVSRCISFVFATIDSRVTQVERLHFTWLSTHRGLLADKCLILSISIKRWCMVRTMKTTTTTVGGKRVVFPIVITEDMSGGLFQWLFLFSINQFGDRSTLHLRFPTPTF